MIRVLAGLAAWLGGTALAVSLAWLGAGMVVRSTTASPSLPPVASAVPPGSAAPSPLPAGAAPAGTVPASPASPVPSSPAPAARHPATSPSRTADPAPAGTARSYALGGGQVTLDLTATSASLVTAVPKAGWAVQTWSGPGWLRVDFSSGPQVSSLIASWNGHAPSVTVTN
jgi:hypothetical protein